ncbi:MAG: HIT domain-containing protein [Alphaproteobacteria bacterium]|nr:HIT domain-containing protein [Alphaproteobacteria bacterium]
MSAAFDRLSRYIESEMRMSHIYQPVMLMELLRQGGSAKTNAIAKAILDRDPSQIEYYEEIVKNMVGRVLTKNRGLTQREGETYRLIDFDHLSAEEIAALGELCQRRLDEFLAKRGDAIWSHRAKSSGYISGTLRYEVLKRAKFRCELCGVSAEERAIEVDHIVPRNHGGTDDLSNLQALCYSHNAMKRDTDATDFRSIAASYNERDPGCLFCTLPTERIIEENELALAMWDAHPVTAWHALIIPKRHVGTYFELYQPELNACHQLIASTRKRVLDADKTVEGFNVGMNCGETAGQTVMHCHIHLIPRRKGDIDNPRGGVRGVIPDKRVY